MNGNDTCANGCSYPSAESFSTKALALASLRADEELTALRADNERLAWWLDALDGMYGDLCLEDALRNCRGLSDWFSERGVARAQRTAALAASARAKLTEEEAEAFLAMPHGPEGVGS